MKKIISIVLVLTMLVSLTGCNVITGLLGGGGYDLEEGESSAVITADGELTVVMAIGEDMLDEDFNADIDDDPEDIMSDMQDMIDEQLDQWDIKSDIEVTEVKVKDDIATVTMVCEDFEFLFPECYETFEDYADMMGGYDVVADNTPFITFDGEDELDDNDLEDYADGTAIGLDGGEEGTYFEFEDDIAIVSDDMRFEMIKSNVIYVKGGEAGLIVLDGEVDCDPEFYGFLMGDYTTDLGGDVITDITPDTTDDGGSIFDNNDTNTTDSNTDTGSTSGPLNGTFIGTYGGDYNTDEYTIFGADGSCTKNLFISNDDFTWYLEIETTASDAEVQAAVETYVSDYFYDVELQNISRTPDGVMITVFSNDPTNISYDYGTDLATLISWYGDAAEFSSYYSFLDYQTGAPLDTANLSSMGNLRTVSVEGGTSGTIYKVPGNILYVDGDVLWQRIDNNTIFIDYWEYGYIIFE